MRQYETFELTFCGPELTDGWAQANILAEFVHDGLKKG